MSEINQVTPEFNSGIAYLNRIHNLKVSVQANVVNLNWESVYHLIWLYYIEIKPRLKQEHILEADDIKNKCAGFLAMKNKNPQTKDQTNAALLEWFTLLNSFEHEVKLVMPDRQDARFALSGKR